MWPNEVVLEYLTGEVFCGVETITVEIRTKNFNAKHCQHLQEKR